MKRPGILFLISLMLLSIPSVAQQKKPLPPPKQTAPDFKKPGSPMPPFRLALMDSTPFLGNALKPNTPTVIYIFSPTCDHCEKVMDTLKAARETFKNAQFVFVAEGVQREHMPQFISRMGLAKIPFFRIMGTDWSNLIYHLYEYQVLPQVDVYNSKGRLAHVFKTHVPMDSLRMFLK